MSIPPNKNKILRNTLKEIVKEILSESPIKSKKTRLVENNRLVGKFYYDKRKAKTFRVISVDGTDRNGSTRSDKKVDMGIQYYDFDTKEPVGKVETIDKSEFDYLVSQGQWSEFKQDFFGSK